jgi:uncharacterized protein YuzE
MRTESGLITVKTAVAPTIEVDSEAGAVYVRFKKGKVSRTIARPAEAMHIAVDLDAKGELVGIEAVGAGRIGLARLLKIALVSAPRLNLGNLRIIACPGA